MLHLVLTSKQWETFGCIGTNIVCLRTLQFILYLEDIKIELDLLVFVFQHETRYFLR